MVFADGRFKKNAVVFALAMILAVFLAKYRWFWGDEGVAIDQILNHGYGRYVLNDADYGNTSPLFFIIFKMLFQLQPLVGSYGVDSVLWMRLVAVVPAAILVAYIFNMARATHAKLGTVIASCLCVMLLGSYSFLEYSWQARHYALWMLATAVYTKAVFDIALSPSKPIKLLKLFSVSAFLALSCMFALLQIAFTGLFILFCRLPRKSIEKICMAMTLPFLYSLSGYMRAGSVGAFIWPGFGEFRHLILANARWTLLLPLLIVLGLLQGGGRSRIFMRWFGFMAALVTFLIFNFWRQRHVHGWFEIPNRYFVFLFPTLAVTLVLALQRFFLSRPAFPRGAKQRRMFLGALFLLAAPDAYRGISAVLRLREATPNVVFVRKTLEKAVSMANGGYICIERKDHGIPSIGRWPYPYLEIRAYNARVGKSCAENSPMHIRLTNEPDAMLLGNDGPYQGAGVKIVGNSAKKTAFDAETSFCD